MAERYYIRRNKEPWHEVSQGEFIAAEREAGFFPKTGCGPVATAGFGISGPGRSIEGRIEGMPDAESLRYLYEDD